MEKMAEILKFESLDEYLLLKNGNYLYKVPFRDSWAVLKVYYDSRTPLVRRQKSLANFLQGQTSYMPKTRVRIERECIRLWQKHGFRVFDLYEDIEVRAPTCRPGGYQLFEYVEAPKLIDFLCDSSISMDDRFLLYRRFLQEWSRRHELAISLREPRLAHENGDGKHVLLLEDDFLWFDFEMVFRSPDNVPYYVAHEILQYIWQMLRSMDDELSQRFLDETVTHYPVKERLASTYEYFFHSPNLMMRALRALDRKLTKRAKKPTSKYNVARRIKERLERL